MSFKYKCPNCQKVGDIYLVNIGIIATYPLDLNGKPDMTQPGISKNEDFKSFYRCNNCDNKIVYPENCDKVDYVDPLDELVDWLKSTCIRSDNLDELITLKSDAVNITCKDYWEKTSKQLLKIYGDIESVKEELKYYLPPRSISYNELKKYAGRKMIIEEDKNFNLYLVCYNYGNENETLLVVPKEGPLYKKLLPHLDHSFNCCSYETSRDLMVECDECGGVLIYIKEGDVVRV